MTPRLTEQQWASCVAGRRLPAKTAGATWRDLIRGYVRWCLRGMGESSDAEKRVAMRRLRPGFCSTTSTGRKLWQEEVRLALGHDADPILARRARAKPDAPGQTTLWGAGQTGDPA